jgi:hypothetical protein
MSFNRLDIYSQGQTVLEFAQNSIGIILKCPR